METGLNSLSTSRFNSLSSFVSGTKGMTQAQAKSLAGQELEILFAWRDRTPEAHRMRNVPPEINLVLDYTGDLKALLSYLDYGTCSKCGYSRDLIRSARDRWSQNEKPGSIADDHFVSKEVSTMEG
jgi:hypothetical protein